MISEPDKIPLLRYFGEGPVPDLRSKTMSRIRGKDTKPEMVLRKALWNEGLRFRVHAKSLPGTPDVSNKLRKVVIFVDGCFWHGCPKHFKIPKTRADFWREKINRNREKRKHIASEYGPGWRVFEFYECALKNDLGEVVQTVTSVWQSA